MTKLESGIVLMLLSLPVAQAKSFSAYWLQSVSGPTDGPECFLARNDKELNVRLEKIGWNKEQYPDVNWQLDVAVVVVPSQSKLGWTLTIFDVVRQGNDAVVKWGWFLPQTPTAKLDAITIGAGGKQAFVVSFPQISGAINCKRQ